MSSGVKSYPLVNQHRWKERSAVFVDYRNVGCEDVEIDGKRVMYNHEAFFVDKISGSTLYNWRFKIRNLKNKERYVPYHIVNYEMKKMFRFARRHKEFYGWNRVLADLPKMKFVDCKSRVDIPLSLYRRSLNKSKIITSSKCMLSVPCVRVSESIISYISQTDIENVFSDNYLKYARKMFVKRGNHSFIEKELKDMIRCFTNIFNEIGTDKETRLFTAHIDKWAKSLMNEFNLFGNNFQINGKKNKLVMETKK